MKYEFHANDYVETKNDARGYVNNVNEMTWKCTQSSNDYMYVAGYTYHIPAEGADSCFNRIGQYDFTKEQEDGKVKPLQKSWVEANGNNEFLFDSREVILKINELVEAVNELRDKND